MKRVRKGDDRDFDATQAQATPPQEHGVELTLVLVWNPPRASSNQHHTYHV